MLLGHQRCRDRLSRQICREPHGITLRVQGNCSEPDAAGALGLEDDLVDTMLPLKPRQCLLVVRESWLLVTRGRLWIDNLYLQVPPLVYA